MNSMLTLCYEINTLIFLKNFTYRVNFVSVHDNGSLDKLLYPILPEILINAQREIYEINYL